jgi:hypothetical protein
MMLVACGGGDGVDDEFEKGSSVQEDSTSVWLSKWRSVDVGRTKSARWDGGEVTKEAGAVEYLKVFVYIEFGLPISMLSDSEEQ